MSDLAEEIQAELTNAAHKDELDLPTLPEVALNIRHTAEDPDVSVIMLAEVISQDPTLAVQIIKIANSAMFRGAQPVDDIGMAVGRMGVDYVANVATGLAMKHMFQATSEVVEDKMREIWNHAKEVAAIANVLAKGLTKLAPDQATLAGLTHSIGALPVLSWAEQNDHLIQDAETLQRVIEKVQGPLGTMILQHWHFPEELTTVPLDINQFDRTPPSVDYTDLVQIANLQSVVGTSHALTERDWATVKAFPRMGLDPDQAHQTLAEFNEVIQMTKELFG